MQGIYFSKKEICGIGGYVCRTCLMINVIIFTISSKIEGITSNCFQVPCLHHYDPPDTTNFNKCLQEKALVEPLKDRIKNLWSSVPNFKVVALEVPDPLIVDEEGYVIANDEYNLVLGFFEGGNIG